jgi:diguanylate cyclase (GGDEF)-like protein
MSADGTAVPVHDAEDRLRAAERAIAHLNRAHSMFSDIRALSNRIKDRDALMPEICRIVVEQGGYSLCRIVNVEHATQRLLPMASFVQREPGDASSPGLGKNYEAALTESAWQVIRENRIVLCDGCVDGDAMSAHGPEGNVRCVELLPLNVAEELVAIAMVGAMDSNAFGEDAEALMGQLSRDISFGLDYLSKVERLQYLTYYDGITGLSNRRLFLERTLQYLQNARANERRMALCLFDIERFKYVNDSLGRSAGDALLKQVGTWLSRQFGNVNRVGRVGADTFGVLLPSLDTEDAASDGVERKLDAFVQQPFRLQDSMFRLAAKVGIAVFPDDGTEPEMLYQHAEAALDQAKNAGERCLRYRRQMTESVAERLNLETRLRHALERSEFRLHYQPKISLKDGRLTGAEALIRWQDPTSGLVPPAQFIPVLEETGLINDVGWWALHQAMEDGRRWHSRGQKPGRLAVNVSPLQLRHPGFVPAVWRLIAAAPFAPADLELEITESVIMESIQHCLGVLNAIREMGVRIAIDDFGTGFSSLSYLSRLPVDSLKIDRSFVVNMTSGPHGLSLVTTIINLAHSLKLDVVAEGVETEEQSRLLRLLGCDDIQGYLRSEPLPADVFEERFLRGPLPKDGSP